jgi:hypothetical protein
VISIAWVGWVHSIASTTRTQSYTICPSNGDTAATNKLGTCEQCKNQSLDSLVSAAFVLTWLLPGVRDRLNWTSSRTKSDISLLIFHQLSNKSKGFGNKAILTELQNP